LNFQLHSSGLFAAQLVLCIPFWIATLVSQSKIVDEESLKELYKFNKFSSGIALAFLYNTIGLLVVKYIDVTIGLIFFALYLAYNIYSAYGHFVTEWKRDRIIRDTIVMLILIIGGILPALGIINF